MKKIDTEERKIELRRLVPGTIRVTIEGTSPLIFHRWSEKAKQMILDKQMKKAAKGREARDPQADYEASFYRDKDGDIALPVLMIKNAIVSAVRNVEGLTMTLIKGALFCYGDNDGFAKVKFGEKNMREDMVRVGMGTADIRFRGEVKDWSVTFDIIFNPTVVSEEQILSLLDLAGFSVGIGEWRPQRSGDYGRFRVKEVISVTKSI